MMIDPETRKKIFQLKKEGHTNTSIKKITGVSFPTIRKIIREIREDSEIEYDDFDDLDDIGELMYDDDVFIVNLTVNYPYREYSIYDRLRNGVPIWDLENQLLKIYSKDYVKIILDCINDKGGFGGIYAVKISKRPDRTEVSVFPIARMFS